MKYILWIMTGILVVGGAMNFYNGPIRFNTKMTVTVEIDGKTYSGSSVAKVRTYMNGFDDAGGKAEHEAVIIDLEDRGKLFALWSRPDTPSKMRDYYYTPSLRYLEKYKQGKKQPSPAKRYRAAWKEYKRRKKPIELEPNQYPILVRFDDMLDVNTVQTMESDQEFRLAFGETARIVSIHVHATNQAATQSDLQHQLPWICSRSLLIGPNGYRSYFKYPTRERLTRANFTTEC